MNSFALEDKVILSLESTILDGVGLSAGRTAGEAGIKTSYSPTGAWVGAELGNFYSSYFLRKITDILLQYFELLNYKFIIFAKLSLIFDSSYFPEKMSKSNKLY